MSDGWSIVESPFRPEYAKAYEGLFTLGSGYLHVRGSLEEHLSDCPQNTSYTRMPANVTSERFPATKSKWGTYVPGVFGRHPLLNNEMINLPWFLDLAPVVDGERLDLEKSRFEQYQRELRLDTATLSRRLVWQTISGRTVEVTFERFISTVHPFLCVQRMTLRVDGRADVEVQAGIDADVRTNGYDHFTRVEVGPAPEGVAVLVHTDADEQVGMLTEVSADMNWRFDSGARWARRVGQRNLSAGEELCVEKRTAVRTSRDLQPAGLTSCLNAARSSTFDELHREHAAAWRKRWESCDVVIDGDAASQTAMRVSLFHLLRAQVPNDPRVAIDAKGYAGEAYWGRFFWDTEMFILPFYLYTDPPRAKTLVDFRVQSLEGARENATKSGYPGARYAWESDAHGRECCPNWHYADHEVHVTADVVYGLAHYAKATLNETFLQGPAATVAVETARFWLDRIDRRPGDAHVSLLGVMGPDEYTPICSNNTYTNAMVAFALDVAEAIGMHGGATESERAAFAETADALPMLHGEDDLLVLQCEEFESLAEPDFDRFWTNRGKTFGAQVSQDRLFRSKCLKQADVLMLMLLFPQEFSEAEVRRAWDYYLPYTTHDSSLSAGVHAIVAARLGRREEAWSFWQRGNGLDLDFEHGGAAEGVHIANAGGVWQMAVFGFGGMRTALQAETFTLMPSLPSAWRRLAFPVVWKGCPVFVEIDPDGVKVLNRGTEMLEAKVYGQKREIQPGSSAQWDRAKAVATASEEET